MPLLGMTARGAVLNIVIADAFDGHPVLSLRGAERRGNLTFYSYLFHIKNTPQTARAVCGV